MHAAPKKSLAMVNPRAGSSELHREFLHLVEDSGGVVRLLDHANVLERSLCDARDGRYERLIVVGGDGSISRAVQALCYDEHAFDVALVPAGTGNDLARSLGVPVDDVEAAWNLALQGKSVPIDIVELPEQRNVFVNGVTGGFGGNQASDVDPEQKEAWGKIAYWLSALTKMGEMPEFDLLVRTPEETRKVRALGFWLANGRTVGGGFVVCPSALLDDGLLDVVIVPSLDALGFLTAGLDYALAGPEYSAQFITMRAKQVDIFADGPMPLSADGESLESQSVSCRILPRKLRMVVGSHEPALACGTPCAQGQAEGTPYERHV
jgi:diacylglycerol kinase (ATP)